MKVKFLTAIVISAIFVFGASGVHAAALSMTGGKVTLGSTVDVNISFSKNVAAAYESNGTAYAAGTLHASGAREYGTTNEHGGLMWMNCTVATVVTSYDTPCGASHVATSGNSDSVHDFASWAVQ